MAERPPPSLRPRGFDDLGLRRALGDRMLPLLVAAMTFLAALALAGSAGAAALVRHWQTGAASALTVQVPAPGEANAADSRLARAVAALRARPDIESTRVLTAAELADLLRPWLGSAGGDLALPLPAVVEVHLRDGNEDVAALQQAVEAAAPGSLVESHGAWVQRLSTLARSLQACAWLALAVVAAVAACVIMIATRAGLSARRESIGIVHGLGATDSYIAGRFAGRATALTAVGALAGALGSLPVLLALGALAAPFVEMPVADAAATEASPHAALLMGALRTVPTELWIGLPALPVVAVVIGFLTAQGTVRNWLRRLP